MTDDLRFRVLGPLEVERAGEPVRVGGRRERALLAYLLLNRERAVERDALVDALWGEEAPATAANALQVAVHGLRKALGRERVVTHGTSYGIALDPGELDLERFETLVRQAASEPPGGAARTLRDALSLHRGSLLADLEATGFVAAERRRAEELRLSALEQRVEADLALGRDADVVGELEALVAANPYRERLRAQLMLALYRSGRQADALEEYAHARAALAGDLGLEPSAELRDLQAAMLRQDPALTAPAGDAPMSRLPQPLGKLVGRQLELAAVEALVRTAGARLVTLTGPGGTGKTRLALAAAHEVLDDFPGGVHFVDLSPIGDDALVLPTAARSLGVRDSEADALAERLDAALAGRETLLVLDNCEHVLEAAPELAALLARVPSLRVLATSREPLRVRGEREFRVPPLQLPAAVAHDLAELRSTESVALFLERARAAQPRLELTAENAAAIVGICRALDGLPLALELAAARVQLLSPATLLERLSDRLAVLTDGDRDLPDRQRTLRATLDWSYRLLTPDERALLARLSVFAGGWTLAAAEEVADADLGTLGSLAQKSLVRSDVGANGEARFSMLETVREYARERLLESGAVESARERHGEHFARVAERLEPDLHTAHALDEAEREHDNVRAALEHALSSGDAALALRLCAFARFWYVRGYTGEGRAWIERALSQDTGPPARRARALYWAATLAWTSGDQEHAIARARESLELARAERDAVAELHALTALGLAQLGLGDLAASRGFHAESLELARAAGRERNVALSLSNIADIDFELGAHAEAEALARESLEIHRRLGDREGTGVALLIVAACMLETGRGDEAVPLVAESVRCFHAVDFKDFVASSLVALARATCSTDARGAARLLGAARALRAPLGPAQFPWEQQWFESTWARVAEAVGEREAEAEMQAGAASPDRAIDESLAAAG